MSPLQGDTFEPLNLRAERFLWQNRSVPGLLWRLLKYGFVFSLGLFLGVFLFYQLANFIRDNEPFGYRLSYRFGKVAYDKYVDKLDKFSFLFPQQDVIEASEGATKRFGKDYLAGFKEKSDPRVGCEVRKGGLKIDMDRDEETISRGLVQYFGLDKGDAKVTRAEKVAIDPGQRPAFQLNFNKVDPTGAVVAVNQLLVPRGNDVYLLICGAGKAYFDKFAPDFAVFFNSFRFE